MEKQEIRNELTKNRSLDHKSPSLRDEILSSLDQMNEDIKKGNKTDLKDKQINTNKISNKFDEWSVSWP